MKAKRIFALILALSLIFAFMAMAVSAVTPRATCQSCKSNDVTTISNVLVSTTQQVDGCSKISTAHTHTISRYKATNVCRSCGRTTYEYIIYVSCN